MSTTDANLPILIDTQALVWAALGSTRLSDTARMMLTAGATRLYVSAVTACEFADLNSRRRFGVDVPLQKLLDRLDAKVLDFPALAWPIMEALPDLHRDPADRMLIAHALHADMTLLTADATIRRYAVRSLW